MYPVSERYKTAIRARERTDRVTGTLTLTDGTVLALGVQDFMSGSLTLDNQCVTGEELAFGCVYLGQAAFSLRTSLSRYAFYGAKLVLRYELQLPGGSWEAVPLGVYTVAEAERKALYVSIKAYDNVLPLQSRWDGTAIQGNACEMLAQIADGCGLELGQTAEEIAALNPNAALACQLSAADGLTTWRDCVAAIAQLLGGFGTVDRAGRLVIRQFAKTSCVSLGADARSEAGVSDFRCHYAALTVATQSGSYAAGGGQDTGLTMAIADMPLAEKGLPDTRQGITDNLFAELRQLDYTPATVTMPGDPAALTVRTAEAPAVSIAFAAVEDTSAMFLAQLLLTAEPEGGDPLTLEVRYYINEVRVENFTPQQRLLAGAHTLALFYPFASVEANAAKRLSVRLVCTGGTVKIAPYSIKATVTGQGMASELPWDGTLQFEELLMPLQLTERKVILE